MNWYRVTTRGHIDKFGVDKTDEGYMHSNCAWTKDLLLAALTPKATQDGISNLQIVDFRPTIQPHARDAKVIDLDAVLGI